MLRTSNQIKELVAATRRPKVCDMRRLVLSEVSKSLLNLVRLRAGGPCGLLIGNRIDFDEKWFMKCI